MGVTTRTKDNDFIITCPYSRAFIDQIKRLGGHWSPPNWIVDIRQQERAREILRNIYGEDGTGDATDTVSVRLTGTRWDDAPDNNVMGFCGRMVCQRRSRDAKVNFGIGVVAINAEFSRSAGSARNPLVGLETDDPIFEVYDIPRTVYEKIKDRPGVELLDVAPRSPSRQQLQQEKDDLLSRIEEIERKLAALNE